MLYVKSRHHVSWQTFRCVAVDTNILSLMDLMLHLSLIEIINLFIGIYLAEQMSLKENKKKIIRVR